MQPLRPSTAGRLHHEAMTDMAKRMEAPGESHAEHRPLPSVKIPLLQNERQAARTRVLVWGSAGCGLCLLLLLIGRSGGSAAKPAAYTRRPMIVAASGGPDPSGGPATAAGIASPTSEDAPHQDEAYTTVRGTVGKVKTFAESLQNMGMTTEEVNELTTAFLEIHRFRTCQPEDEITIKRDISGKIVSFEYKPSAIVSYVARRRPDGSLDASKEREPVRVEHVTKAGVIQTSLGEALSRSGLNNSLVGTFVEVFAGKVSFTTDAQKGDGFSVILEERYLKDNFLGYGAIHALEWKGARHGRLRAYWFDPQHEEPGYFDESGRKLHGSWLRAPLHYERLSSRYNPERLHPTLKKKMPHLGVDFAASRGTPVWASAPGRVTIAGRKGPNGNLVGIRHSNGYETRYAHLHRIARGIRSGVTVKQRQVVGYVGSTGRSTGPHLHFALKRHGRFMDPVPVMFAPGAPLRGGERRKFQRKVGRLSRKLARLHR